MTDDILHERLKAKATSTKEAINQLFQSNNNCTNPDPVVPIDQRCSNPNALTQYTSTMSYTSTISALFAVAKDPSAPLPVTDRNICNATGGGAWIRSL